MDKFLYNYSNDTKLEFQMINFTQTYCLIMTCACNVYDIQPQNIKHTIIVIHNVKMLAHLIREL